MNKTQHNIEITTSAIKQIQLMKENDYTLQDKVLRLSISGKECYGFNYSLGFDRPHQDDNIVDLANLADGEIIDAKDQIKLHLDDFSFHFFSKGIIDYTLDAENNVDGFVVTNHDQDNFKGKFFKDTSKDPLHLLKK